MHPNKLFHVAKHLLQKLASQSNSKIVSGPFKGVNFGWCKLQVYLHPPSFCHLSSSLLFLEAVPPLSDATTAAGPLALRDWLGAVGVPEVEPALTHLVKAILRRGRVGPQAGLRGQDLMRAPPEGKTGRD